MTNQSDSDFEWDSLQQTLEAAEREQLEEDMGDE